MEEEQVIEKKDKGDEKMLGQIVVLLMVTSFILMGVSIFAFSGFPLVASLPFGYGEWFMANAPIIFASSIFIFLMSMSLAKGTAVSWTTVGIYFIISVISYVIIGGWII